MCFAASELIERSYGMSGCLGGFKTAAVQAQAWTEVVHLYKNKSLLESMLEPRRPGLC